MSTPVWVYGINDHLDVPADLPSGFDVSGNLCADFRSLCDAVGAAPHPAFKPRPRKSVASAQKKSGVVSTEVVESPVNESEPYQEGPYLAVRSFLLDRLSVGLASLLLPNVQSLKVLVFSDCNLDSEMLKLLAAGLKGDCSIESLQVEYNTLELPLPLLAEIDAEAPASEEQEGEGDRGKDEANAWDNATRALEARERKRYSMQSERLLRSFKEWLESTHGNLEAVWKAFGTDVKWDGNITAADFHVMLYEKLGLSGPQVLEVFEVLDGPDYGAEGGGQATLNTLRHAIESLPEERVAEEPDPIGITLAAFLDAKTVLESMSLRSCGVSRLELGPMSDALAKCPWQLRCLNLWENRICDRGAELLATALDAYRGLEYLGLGRNRITDAGLQILCRPFTATTLDDEQAAEARKQIASQEAQAKSVADAKDKAQGQEFSGRQRRVPVPLVDDLEERPPSGDSDRPTFVLKKASELKSLVVSENPIKSMEVVEAIQPHGPRGAELILRGTAAATELGIKKPELLKDRERRPLLTLQQTSAAPPPEGWILRITPF
eukprot:TRINITY_DN92692_c0_g1_i1.p1 TRINITY_DN92692_c0_g1~~TRINITY_DN92692_c0_g1_i1.p1  ORF type:complete len:551 (+),score=115.17 TRINITY_DN92692_c0_g1_i1:33-1685(+)